MERPLTLIIFISVVIAAVALVVYLSSDSKPGGESETRSFRGCTAEESATQQAEELVPTPTQILPGRISAEELNRLSREQAGTPFVGKLCDFEIVASLGDILPRQYCKSEVTQLGGESGKPIIDSELNGRTVFEQTLCEGTPVASRGQIGTRAYFKGRPGCMQTTPLASASESLISKDTPPS